jgi:hypothetical protein
VSDKCSGMKIPEAPSFEVDHSRWLLEKSGPFILEPSGSSPFWCLEELDCCVVKTSEARSFVALI